jgi:predicted ATPase/DNA-binding CsgD family transcriptional regulator
MGVPNTPGQPIMARLGAYLRDHRLVMALDNFEHLLDAAPLITDLMDQSESLTVLVTSRARLNLSGEHVFPVRPLASDASVDLFGQRAKAITPGFDLTPELLPTIDAICTQLDRLPLAIELAAARIAVLAPAALLDRLSDPLSLLTGGPRDAPDRQRTMRSVIAWSIDLLPAEVQVLFRRLGVFVGGFTFEAAAAVTGVDNDVLDGLETLIASSLLTTSPAAGGVPRFAMLETIREFALDRLTASGEEATARSRHAAHYMRATESELPNQDGPGVRAAHDRIEADMQNCRAALTWSLERGETEIGIRLAGALWRTWLYNSAFDGGAWQERTTEGRLWLDKTLARRDGLPLSVVTEALAGAAQLANLSHDFLAAQSWAEELQARAQAQPYAYATFWAGMIMGHLAAGRQEYDTARAWYVQAIQAAPGIRNPESGLSQVLAMKADAERLSGHDTDAIADFEHSMALARVSGNSFAISLAAAYFGRFLHQRGDLQRATRILGEALASNLHERRFDAATSTAVEITRIAIEAGFATRAVAVVAAARPLPTIYFGGIESIHDDEVARAVQGLSSRADAAAPDDSLPIDWHDVLTEIEALAQAIGERAAQGEIPRQVSRFGLTPRELEVTKLLAAGRSNRAIAEQLSLSQRTIEHHVLHILTKLGLESRSAVAAFAVRNDLA